MGAITNWQESGFRKNPIVYLSHLEDIYPAGERNQYKFKWRDLLPSKRTGFEIRKILYNNKDPKKVSKGIIDLMKTMRNVKNVKFMPAGELLSLLQSQKDK